LVIGYYGLRAVNTSEGRLHGRRLAVAGMMLAAAALLADLLGGGAYLVLHVRTTSQRAECANNLRQMGLALGSYYDRAGTLPPGTISNERLQPEQRLSWLVSLLADYAELDAVSRKRNVVDSEYFAAAHALNREKAWNDTINAVAVERRLRGFLCPAHPDFGGEPPPGRTHYVGIAGIGADAAELPPTHSRAGVFGYDRRITYQEVTAGISETLLAAETMWGNGAAGQGRPSAEAGNGPWAAGGRATVRALEPMEVPYTGRGRPFGGLHPGIVNVLYVDGSSRPFRDDAPPEQFAILATLRHGTGVPAED
jgi:hypothetical protein